MVLGKRVTKYMSRHRHLAPGEEATTYDLRHAWAARVRASDYSH